MKRLIVVAPLLVLAAAGCSSSSSASSFDQPKASAFHSGDCQTIAPTVLSLGRSLHTLGSAKEPSSDLKAAFKTTQDQLAAQQAKITGPFAATVQDFVTAVGILRLRSDTNEYSPTLQQTAMDSYKNLVATCTTDAPTSATPTPSPAAS